MIRLVPVPLSLPLRRHPAGSAAAGAFASQLVPVRRARVNDGDNRPTNKQPIERALLFTYQAVEIVVIINIITDVGRGRAPRIRRP